MFKQLRLCSLLMTLGAGSLFGYGQPNASGLQVSADFLYYMPSFDDTYFVTRSDTTTTFANGTRLHNDFDFKPGFRVALGYSLEGTDLEIAYSRLSASQKRNVTGTNLWATLGNADLAAAFENYAGSALSDLTVLYHRVDAVLGQEVVNCYGLDVSINAGLEYAFLRLNEAYTYQIAGGATGIYNRFARTWGIGPQLGFGIDYVLMQDTCSIPGILSLTASSSGSLLGSETGNRESSSLAGVSLLNVNDESTWRIIPALHAKVGINYDFCLMDMAASLEVGYEFSTYVRALSRPTYNDDVADGLVNNNYYNYDLQGLYVSAGLSF